MAVDEAILESVAAGQAPPTLRLYSWQPWCLSLGYFQPFAQVDVAACRRLGIDIVRRPTGGSAILHAQELTYSIIVPITNPLVAGDILTSYRKISSALATGLRGLNLPVELASSQGLLRGRRDPEGNGNLAGFVPQATGYPAPCFLRPAAYEIMTQGKKLVGSAQMRRNGVLLQHGAIPLAGDPVAILNLLRLSQVEEQAARRDLEQRAITIEAALGRKVTFEEVAQALVEGFRRAWNINFTLGILLPMEESLTQRLVVEKYNCAAWTEKV